MNKLPTGAHPMTDLLSMWKYPRMILAFLGALAVCVFLRSPLVNGPLLPDFLFLRPDLALVPVLGAALGPAGAWAALVAGFVGDRLFGAWGGVPSLRAASDFLYAVHMMRFSDVILVFDRRDTTKGFSFAFFALPAIAAHAAMTGLGAEISRHYPFVYVATLTFLRDVLLAGFIGLPLYLFVSRRFQWQKHMHAHHRHTPSWAHAGWFACMLIGGVGALAGGLWLSVAVYKLNLWQPFMLGSSTGAGLVWFTGFLLTFYAAALFTRR